MSDHKHEVRATIFPSPRTPFVSPKLVDAVRRTEKELGVRVFCLIHKSGTDDDIDSISPFLHQSLIAAARTIPRDQPIALLLDSPGGDAHSAYRIAKFLNRHCGGYSVIVPRWAKSAATLLSLGASTIYCGDHAEFGPIDVQVVDREHERRISALEMVQSMERLNSEAMQAMDAMMSLLIGRSGKRIDSLLPSVLKYATDVTRPIFEKIDTVAFTYHARLLKIGEEYGTMLLRERYPERQAQEIAVTLTRGYPDHAFVIDCDEARRIGLEVKPIPDALREPLGPYMPSYTKSTVLGFLEDATDATEPATPPARAATDGQPLPAGSKPPGRVRGKRRAGNRVGENGSA